MAVETFLSTHEVDAYRNECLQRARYEYALAIDRECQRVFADAARDYHVDHGHPGEPGLSCRLCHPPIPWRRRLWMRLRSWWNDHRPRVHFGPCDDGDDW